MPTHLTTGQRVRVRNLPTDEWATGVVALASPVSDRQIQAVGIHLNGGVRAGSGLIFGALPLTIDYANETATGLTGDTYELDYLPL